MLMPLREELRRNNLITRQAAKVLGLIRKNGVDNTVCAVQPEIVSDTQRFSLGQQRHIVAYMASLVDFEHEEYQLPDHNEVPSYKSPTIPDYNQVRLAFSKSTKKRTEILAFLSEQYPDLEADEMFYLYQKLINESDLTLTQSLEKKKMTISGHTFRLYPFNAVNKQDKHNDTN